jgi:hypothetical protein
MEERLAAVGSRIDSLMSRVRDMGADADHHVHEVMEDLYSSVEREVKRIEGRIRSTNDADEADATKARAELLESLRDELALWRGRLEGLRLQATLGRMDFDHKMQPAIERIEVLYYKARRYLHDMAHDELAWDELEPLLLDAMTDLRHEFDEAGKESSVAYDE